MKKNILLSVMFVLAGLFVSQSANAQQIDQNSGQVVWLGTKLADAVDLCNTDNDGDGTPDGFVYLLQFQPTLSADNPEKYISSGGAYGVQGVLSTVGMRMQIFKTTYTYYGRTYTYYEIASRVQNSGTAAHQGDRMGFDGIGTGKPLYLDRGTDQAGNNYPQWTISESTSTKRNIKFKDDATSRTVSVNTITIRGYDSDQRNYIGVNSNGRLVSSNSATTWVIVSEEDYKNAMQAVTWGEVDLGVFVQDAEFGRDNKDASYWEWGTWSGTDWVKAENQNDSWQLSGDIHWHQRNQNNMCNGVLLSNGITRAKVGTNVAESNNYNADGFRNAFGQYYKAEIYNEAIALSQTLNGSKIPNLTEGLYKLTAQALYHDGNRGTTNNNISYFVVKRVEHKTDGDEVSIERLPVKPMNSLSGNNITAQSGVSAGYKMNGDANKNNYLLEFFLEITGNTDITIGIEQTQATGWTVIGNVHLYAHGKQAIFLDEDWCAQTSVPFKENGVDKWSTGNPYQHSEFNKEYEYPATCYYNRTFTKGKFNPICLPIALTGNQVRQAFGNDCMLSKFTRVTKGGWSVIVFEPVDLDGIGKVTEAGVPYIVKVTTDPFLEAGKQMKVEVGNGGQNHTVTLDGPIYTIPGITKDDTSGFSDGLPTLKPTTADGFTFEGTYYFTSISQDDVKNGSEDYWLIRKGNMYYLTGETPSYIYEFTVDEDHPHGAPIKTDKRGYMIWGTYAYLHAPKNIVADAKNLTFGLMDEWGDITAIDIEGMEVPQSQAIEDNSVYTMNGLKIGGKGNLNGLSKGIYIVNGKKYVVK